MGRRQTPKYFAKKWHFNVATIFKRFHAGIEALMKLAPGSVMHFMCSSDNNPNQLTCLASFRTVGLYSRIQIHCGITYCGKTVKGPPLDLKGKTLLLLTVVLLRFLPTIPLLGGGILFKEL